MPVSDLSKSKGAADFAYDRFLVREFAADVRAGLSRPQKELHSKYLYDDLGSALFEAITHLPEYGLTRADERLLETHASDIVHSMHKAGCVIELGSGTGRKTRHVLAAMRTRTSGRGRDPSATTAISGRHGGSGPVSTAG